MKSTLHDTLGNILKICLLKSQGGCSLPREPVCSCSNCSQACGKDVIAAVFLGGDPTIIFTFDTGKSITFSGSDVMVSSRGKSSKTSVLTGRLPKGSSSLPATLPAFSRNRNASALLVFILRAFKDNLTNLIFASSLLCIISTI